jgi:tetratricopeptide (TPR) repeat protein
MQTTNQATRTHLESALEDARRVWGKKHRNTIAAMNDLAISLNDEDEAPRARELLTTVVEWCSRKLGEDDLETLTAKANLALRLFDLRLYDEARELEEEVLTKRQRDLGETHPETLEAMGSLGATLNNMAVALRNAGDLTQAAPLQFQALDLVTSAFGPDDLMCAFMYSATGELLKLQGDVEQARSYFEKAIAIRQRELGPDAALTQLVEARLRETLH